MAARILMLLALVAPGALFAQEFDIRRTLRGQTKPTDEVKTPKSFSEFALGNWGAVYPYHELGPWRPRSKGDWPLLQNFEGQVSALIGFDGGTGFAVDSHFTFTLFHLGSLARVWNAGRDSRDIVAAGTFAGFAGPVWIGQCSVGIGPAFIATEGNAGKAALLVTTHVTLFPLWPLSVSIDGSFISAGKDRMGDVGARLGCMAYRHLFVEVGYRVTFLPEYREVNQGLSLGLSFHWNWGTGRPMFDAPHRPGTW